MPRQSLQRQGVPIPESLPVRRHTVRDRTPLDGHMGGTRDTTTVYERPTSPRAGTSGISSRQSGQSQRVRQSRNSGGRRAYSAATAPISAGNAAGGVGLLEAEFLLAIVLLVMLLFANTEASYTDKIMSAMKRGTLTCLLFFLLALISSIGPNAAKITKAIGALVIVAILVTSPIGTVGTDIDNLIKNDWVGTGESNQSSADAGTASGASGAIANLETQAELFGSDQKTGAKPLSKAGLEQDAKNALQATAGGIIPGLGTILGKIGL